MVNYIEGDSVKITPNDGIFVDLEFYTGEKFYEIELHKLFPITGNTKYISLRDTDGKEIGIIRDVNTLLPESRETVLNCLREYYLIPKIKRFIKMDEQFLIWMWTVETDRGITKFEIRNHVTALKTLYDGRVLIKDANDNRYEVPDVNKLDQHSYNLIYPKL